MSVKINFIFLLKAIKERLPIEISYPDVDKTWEYISRFVKLSADSQSFIIDLPEMEGTYKPLKKGHSIYIFFTIKIHEMDSQRVGKISLNGSRPTKMVSLFLNFFFLQAIDHNHAFAL